MSDDLRNRIAEAGKNWALANPIPAWGLGPQEHWDKLATNWGRLIADAVMAVVQPETIRARASCCEDGERTYGEMERHYEAAIERVRALHVRNANTGDCEHCSERDYPAYAVPWPCPTIAALDHREETSG